jgi:REP element-mobilizing transposase RayT
LFEARKRYGLRVLNYMVTSNHVHLLLADDGEEGTIPQSIQLIAGRTGQEYNRRKKRRGAFWEDRYHATAVGCDQHLAQGMLYVDMNMVRAGVVKSPEEWPFCGYHEIQDPKKRYRIIDYQKLMELFQVKDFRDVQDLSRAWVTNAVASQNHFRESRWTESIAVGTEGFVKATQEKLGIKGKGREILGSNGSYQLREAQTTYNGNFDQENSDLRSENTYFWENIS